MRASHLVISSSSCAMPVRTAGSRAPSSLRTESFAAATICCRGTASRSTPSICIIGRRIGNISKNSMPSSARTTSISGNGATLRGAAACNRGAYGIRARTTASASAGRRTAGKERRRPISSGCPSIRWTSWDIPMTGEVRLPKFPASSITGRRGCGGSARNMSRAA